MMYLPPPPSSQGLVSTTFTVPPLDGSICIPDLIKFHACHSRDHPLFIHRGSVGEDIRITWSNFADAVHQCARLVIKSTGLVPSTSNSSPIVAILAAGDTVTYAILLFGILRAGLVPFLVSPRNSASAVLHLLETSGTHHIFITEDHAVQKLIETAIINTKFSVFLHSITKEVVLSSVDHHTTDSSSAEFLSKDSTMVMHSSGSTGFPKTTELTQSILLQYARIPYYGDIDFCGHIVSIHAVPMFHMQGVAFLLRAMATGFVLAVFPPQTQPIIPSPARVLSGIKDDGCTMLVCVPSFLQSWSVDEHAIEVLRKLEAVIFAGAPLSQKAGDKLATLGVKLHMYYAGTEVGCVSKFISRLGLIKDWQYISFSPHFEAHFVPQDSQNIFELVTVESPAYTPGVVNTSINGKNAFATGDLFIRHPTDLSLWRVSGRVDDLIVLSTGEKTNPAPIEAIFLEEPRISKAIMFGRERPHNGIILELDTSASDGLSDPYEEESFDEVLRRLTKQANAVAPSHSRLYKEMILFAYPSKPFLLTSKGSVRRGAVLELYRPEIEQAYEIFGLTTEIALPVAGNTEPNYHLLIDTILTEVLGESVGGLVDVFQQGCDSIQATMIRNMIIAALLPSKPDLIRGSIPLDIVYRYPRPKELVEFVQHFMAGEDVSIDRLAEKINLMKTMVAQFIEGIPYPDTDTTPGSETVVSPPSSDVVLLTGTTGTLGSYILAELVNRSDINHIYAVNRHHPRDSRPLLDRQTDAFVVRYLDPSILQSPKVTLIETDISTTPWKIADKFHHQVTVVIHAAWPVDFNQSLSSFSSTLRGLCNLINFAASLPHGRLLFISSTGMFRNWSSEEFITEGPVHDPMVAVGLGYTESKWVAEQVLDTAAERLHISISIVRVGQLSGGIKGAWNTAEWLPSIVQSAQSLGCLPMCDRLVSWLPVDAVARCVVELMKCPQMRYFHVEHPQPVPWLTIFKPLANLLNVKLVPFGEWLRVARDRASSDPQNHFGPPKSTNKTSGKGLHDASYPQILRMLSYFELKGSDGAYYMERNLVVNIEKTFRYLSPSHLKVASLNEGDVREWVEYWRSVGFLAG